MCFLTIEDIYGPFEVMIFAKLYTKFKDLCVEDGLVTIKGRISIRPGKNPCVIAEKIIGWDKINDKQDEEQKLYLRFDTKDIDIYDRVKNIIASYPGKSQVVIKCLSSNKAFAFSAKVNLNNYLQNELIGLLGEQNVIVK